ncbi:hypothetical protein PPGU19_072710 (plasmid) [Paraburkholderia sp. PGU19]|nr:hypothetical protein PPGU19_072710 [Paraburkholderia sp. PGU19]
MIGWRESVALKGIITITARLSCNARRERLAAKRRPVTMVRGIQEAAETIRQTGIARHAGTVPSRDGVLLIARPGEPKNLMTRQRTPASSHSWLPDGPSATNHWS